MNGEALGTAFFGGCAVIAATARNFLTFNSDVTAGWCIREFHSSVPLHYLWYGTILRTMRIEEDIKSITYMKMRSADLVREVRKNRRPIVITQNGEASAVVLDVASYEALRDAAVLMKLVSQSEQDARRGRTRTQGAVFSRIEARIAAARGAADGAEAKQKRRGSRRR